jgi:hypothetical protein
MSTEEPMTKRQRDLLAVANAVSLALPSIESGHIFSHEWLYEAFDMLPEPESVKEHDTWKLRYMKLVDMWQYDLLFHHGIHVENTHGKGYQIIDQHDTAHVVSDGVRRDMGKTISQAYAKLTRTNASDLTNAEITARHDEMSRLGRIALALNDGHIRRKKLAPARMIDAG